MSILSTLQKRLSLIRSKLTQGSDIAESRFMDFKQFQPENDSSGKNLEEILERIRAKGLEAKKENMPVEPVTADE